MSLKTINQLITKAQKHQAKIIFPETFDARTLKALAEIIKKKICQPVLIGTKKTLKTSASKHRVKLNLDTCLIIDPSDSKLQNQLTKRLLQIRGKKGLTPVEAQKLLTDINYFSIMLLEVGVADGIVSGAASTTADTLRPAFQIIKTSSGKKLCSGAFLMCFKNRPPILFADCAVNPRPTPAEIATIAIESAETALFLGLQPKIALLSFSTHGSSTHPDALATAEAAKILRRRLSARSTRRIDMLATDRRSAISRRAHSNILIDGELQADAALVQSVAHFKSPKSQVKGLANVLIFPSLEAGNIAYKLVERLAGAEAIGTIVQGLSKPVNDLSRGCKPSDIVALAAITALQTKHQ